MRWSDLVASEETILPLPDELVLVELARRRAARDRPAGRGLAGPASRIGPGADGPPAGAGEGAVVLHLFRDRAHDRAHDPGPEPGRPVCTCR